MSSDRKRLVGRFHSIRFRMRIAILLVSVLLTCAVEITMLHTIRNTVEDSMISRMGGEINYIEDLIGEEEWHAEDGALYCGDIRIGDGTVENAFLDPFLELERETGSFSYTFVRCPDGGLEWVGDKGSGYQQGHYLRVSGSTLTSDGRKIIGTYMDKKVADELDEKGFYAGRANVVGETVFCFYRTLENADGEIVGVIVVGRSIEEIKDRTAKAAGILLWIIIVLVVASGFALHSFIIRWLAKLDIANGYLRDISTGVFPKEPLDLNTKDELLVTAQCINEMTGALKEKARITGELEAAANIQAHMLPLVFPEESEFGIYAVMHPAREVGGDFYDFFMIDPSRLAVVIADVSGKGVPAALFMAIAKKLIKSYTMTGMEPCDVFTNVNRLLCEDNEANIFITAWMGVLDLNSGKLTYVNAGHNPPLIRLGEDRFSWLKAPAGMVLAAFDSVKYGQSELVMSPGDRLLLYTDGVTEAEDAADRLYGQDRLMEHANSHTGDGTKELLQGLKRDIDRFAGEREQSDDITMLILDYRARRADDACEMRSFPATEEKLQDVIAFVEDELGKAGAPAKAVTQITIAAEEIFINIASYAYPRGTGSVDVGIKVDGGTARLRFEDSGVPFDPTQAEEPDVTLPAEERPVGGLGILLAKKTMDSMEYGRRDGRNRLVMTKKLGQ